MKSTSRLTLALASLALIISATAYGQADASRSKVHAAPAPRSKLIDAARLLAAVQTLSSDEMQGRKTGTDGGAKARAYIVKAFNRSELEPYAAGYLQPFTFKRGADTYQANNIVGYIRGKSAHSRAIVVSAHYDHLGIVNGEIYHGADDNASGVATLLALADYFYRYPPTHTIVFVAFDGEEEGLQGSQYFIKSPPLDLKSVAVNVNMDMVSRNERGELYAAGATPYPFLKPYLEEIAKGAPVRLLIGHDDPKLGHDDWTLQSDQGAFHMAGIPFVYFGVEDHKDYHKPTDTFANIDPPFFVHSAETILSFVQLLDKNLDKIDRDRAVKN